jgi:hypothetical protein
MMLGIVAAALLNAADEAGFDLLLTDAHAKDD